MRDGALPAVVLCLALGLLLAHAPRRRWLFALLAVSASALPASAFAYPPAWQAPILVACWVVTLLFIAGVLVARPLPFPLALALAAAAGLLTGLLTGEAGRPEVLAAALPCLLVRVPAAVLLARRRGIVLKVLASWLGAVAILSAELTLATGASVGADHLDWIDSLVEGSARAIPIAQQRADVLQLEQCRPAPLGRRGRGRHQPLV